MKINFKHYWAWYYLATLLLSFADFIEHITRADDRFLQIWVSWFIFTLCSVLVVLGFTYFINFLLHKPFKGPNLIIELISVFIPFYIHINFSGPLLDLMIFGGDALNFFATSSIYILPIAIFIFIRLMHRLISIKSKKKVANS